MNRQNLVGIFAFITVISQHFALVNIGTYPLTLGFLSGCVLVALASRGISLQVLTAVWMPLLALASLAALVQPETTNAFDFGTTLALALVTTFFIAGSSRGFRDELWASPALWGALRACLAVVVTLSAVQVASGHFGIGFFFNPFRSFQYGHQYAPELQFTSYPRAEGFFLEPSYDAFVIGTLSVALLLQRKHLKSTLILAFVGMACTQSATGLILLLCIALIFAMKSKPGIAIAVVTASLLLVAILGRYLVGRLSSINATGSSANYRLVEPIKVIRDVLTLHPLGMPLGSIYDVVAKYGLVMDGVQQTISLDNGLYVVIYYFGWIGLGLLLLFAGWAVRGLFRPSQRGGPSVVTWVGPIWLLGAMLFSGGIVAPEFGLMTWILLSTYRSARMGESQIEYTENRPDGRNRDLQRRVGFTKNTRIRARTHDIC
ncbi:putative colanic acid polymerase WcaD [Frondihabitans sp. PAMC 28766]|uniref:putative colanic acid polymerase WcaD n=1 Tax=Frondihabitans sp. PAMC 28766 TaxID=1795630 RepID=UPI000A8F38EB|nr:putative colanic acid polymerase WcaD [Frondihabitans sp. PAMC 28766]